MGSLGGIYDTSFHHAQKLPHEFVGVTVPSFHITGLTDLVEFIEKHNATLSKIHVFSGFLVKPYEFIFFISSLIGS